MIPTPTPPDPTSPPSILDRLEAGATQDQLLQDITRDFERLQKQKARRTGGVESRILLACAFDWGEHYVGQMVHGIVAEPQEKNKLYLVFNLIGQRRQRLMGRLAHSELQFGAQPSRLDPKSLGDAEVVEKLIRGLDRLLDQDARTWELLDWLTKGGVAFEHVCWIPNATMVPMPQFDAQNAILFKDLQTNEILSQEARDFALQSGAAPERFEIHEEVVLEGEVGSEILSPLTVFLDQSVKSIEQLGPDQAVYIAKIRTRGWIEETYGDHVDLSTISYDKSFKIVTTDLIQSGEAVSSLFLKDMIPTVQGERQDDDPDMAVVVDRYLPASKANPHGQYTVFIPGKLILWHGANPYPEIPLVDFHFQAVTTTFWTKDYVTDLIAAQRFLNKRMSQLGEQANASIYDKLLLAPGLSEVDIPADYPGVIKHGLTEEGASRIQRLPGPQLPQWFLESIKEVTGLFNEISGGTDLTEHARFPGQLRGPMAVPMLQEIMDTEWGPLYRHLAQRLARVKQMRLNRVKQYYPKSRTLHFTNRDQRDEVLEFHAEPILRAGTDYLIAVEATSVIPELRALREERVERRLQSPLALLYMDERTGHLDKSKVAMDLRMGDYGREDRESASRKFAQDLIAKLWQGQAVPPVLQFWDHAPMMDELEHEMMTTEFLSASPPVQRLFLDRWNQHLAFLQQKAQRMQDSMQNQMLQSAVAQATQQAAAKAAAEAVDLALHQVQAQQTTTPGPGPVVQAATQQQLAARPAVPPTRPPLPFQSRT